MSTDVDTGEFVLNKWLLNLVKTKLQNSLIRSSSANCGSQISWNSQAQEACIHVNNVQLSHRKLPDTVQVICVYPERHALAQRDKIAVLLCDREHSIYASFDTRKGSGNLSNRLLSSLKPGSNISLRTFDIIVERRVEDKLLSPRLIVHDAHYINSAIEIDNEKAAYNAAINESNYELDASLWRKKLSPGSLIKRHRPISSHAAIAQVPKFLHLDRVSANLDNKEYRDIFAGLSNQDSEADDSEDDYIAPEPVMDQTTLSPPEDSIALASQFPDRVSDNSNRNRLSADDDDENFDNNESMASQDVEQMSPLPGKQTSAQMRPPGARLPAYQLLGLLAKSKEKQEPQKSLPELEDSGAEVQDVDPTLISQLRDGPGTDKSFSGPSSLIASEELINDSPVDTSLDYAFVESELGQTTTNDAFAPSNVPSDEEEELAYEPMLTPPGNQQPRQESGSRDSQNREQTLHQQAKAAPVDQQITTKGSNDFAREWFGASRFIRKLFRIPKDQAAVLKKEDSWLLSEIYPVMNVPSAVSSKLIPPQASNGHSHTGIDVHKGQSSSSNGAGPADHRASDLRRDQADETNDDSQSASSPDEEFPWGSSPERPRQRNVEADLPPDSSALEASPSSRRPPVANSQPEKTVETEAEADEGGPIHGSEAMDIDHPVSAQAPLTSSPPVASEDTSVASEDMSVASEDMPAVEEEMPVAEAETPVVGEEMLAAGEAMPVVEEEMSAIEEGMPAIGEDMNTSSLDVNSVPTASQHQEGNVQVEETPYGKMPEKSVPQVPVSSSATEEKQSSGNSASTNFVPCTYQKQEMSKAVESPEKRASVRGPHTPEPDSIVQTASKRPLDSPATPSSMGSKRSRKAWKVRRSWKPDQETRTPQLSVSEMRKIYMSRDMDQTTSMEIAPKGPETLIARLPDRTSPTNVRVSSKIVASTPRPFFSNQLIGTRAAQPRSWESSGNRNENDPTMSVHTSNVRVINMPERQLLESTLQSDIVAAQIKEQNPSTSAPHQMDQDTQRVESLHQVPANTVDPDLKQLPEKFLEELPEGLPEKFPEQLPKGLPGTYQEEFPEQFPEKLPDIFPEDFPKQLPDLPKKFPEEYPEQLPEELPKKRTALKSAGIRQTQNRETHELQASQEANSRDLEAADDRRYDSEERGRKRARTEESEVSDSPSNTAAIEESSLPYGGQPKMMQRNKKRHEQSRLDKFKANGQLPNEATLKDIHTQYASQTSIETESEQSPKGPQANQNETSLSLTSPVVPGTPSSTAHQPLEETLSKSVHRHSKDASLKHLPTLFSDASSISVPEPVDKPKKLDSRDEYLNESVRRVSKDAAINVHSRPNRDAPTKSLPESSKVTQKPPRKDSIESAPSSSTVLSTSAFYKVRNDAPQKSEPKTPKETSTGAPRARHVAVSTLSRPVISNGPAMPKSEKSPGEASAKPPMGRPKSTTTPKPGKSSGKDSQPSLLYYAFSKEAPIKDTSLQSGSDNAPEFAKRYVGLKSFEGSLGKANKEKGVIERPKKKIDVMDWPVGPLDGGRYEE